MKRCVRVAVLTGLILSVIVSVLALTAAPALAQAGNMVIVNTGAAHVRSGPSAFTTSLGTVAGGIELPVTGRSANSGWWRVTSAYGTGWVSAELVVFRGTLETVPVVSEPAGTAETPTVIVDRFPATVYRNPNRDSFVVGISPTGAALNVLGRSTDGNWWQVQTPLGAGWVSAGDVAFRGNEASIQRVGDPGPSFDGPTIRVNITTPVTTQPGGGDTIATLDAGTAIPATGRNADNTWWQVTGVFGIGWIPVNSISMTGASTNIRQMSDTSIGGPAYTGAAFATAIVEVERKVAYAEDGFSSAPMWAAGLGEQLGVIARSPDGLWLRVTKTGFSGWMHFSGLTLNGSMAGIPVYDIVVPSNNVAVVNIHRLNIRSGPGAEFDDLTSVPGGTVLNVTGRHPTLPWLRVSGGWGQGWVRIMHIIFRGTWNEVPFVTEPAGVLEVPQAWLEAEQIVYSQPGLDNPTGWKLGMGLYNILGWTADYKWAKIQTPSGDVWIQSESFGVRGTWSNAPVLQ